MNIISRDGLILLVGSRFEQWICGIDNQGIIGCWRAGVEEKSGPAMVSSFIGATEGEVKAAIESIKVIEKQQQEAIRTKIMKQERTMKALIIKVFMGIRYELKHLWDRISHTQ